jgi:Fic family protein
MDLTGWLEFFVTGLSTQLNKVRLRGEHAIHADVIAASKRLNARQASLVAAFLDRPRLTLAEAEKLLPDVARRTVQRDLKLLVDAGLIGERGHGPTDRNRRVGGVVTA